MKRGWKERAQATIFIIIAVVLVGAVIVTFFLNKNISSFDNKFSSNPDINAKFDQLKLGIEACMKDSANDALTNMGYQGGYFKMPVGSFDLGWTFIPHYYDNGKFGNPSFSEVQKNLGLETDLILGLCLNEIEKNEFEVSYGDPKTNVKVTKDQALFTIDMPISIRRDDKVVRLELRDNPIVIDSKLFEMYEIADFITKSHKDNAKTLCISCVSNMADERKLIVNIASFGLDDGALVSIMNNNTDYSPGLFQFLNKYPAND